MKVKRQIRLLLLSACISISADLISDTIEVPDRYGSDSSPVISESEVNGAIVEHKTNGRIDSIEIKPIIGQTYYLIDNDDKLRKGVNQSRGPNEILSNWRLFKW